MKPVAVTVNAEAPAPPDETFAIVAPIDLATIFHKVGPIPAVTGVEDQTGEWDHVGASRRPQLSDGTSVFEQLTEFDAPEKFAYDVSGFTNAFRHLVKQAHGRWLFTPSNTGTHIEWTYEFDPQPGRRWILRVGVAPIWRRSMTRAIDGAIREVERRTN